MMAQRRTNAVDNSKLKCTIGRRYHTMTVKSNAGKKVLRMVAPPSFLL